MKRKYKKRLLWNAIISLVSTTLIWWQSELNNREFDLFTCGFVLFMSFFMFLMLSVITGISEGYEK